MPVISMKLLLEAGVHFGHQTRRWNPKMAKYIYTSRNGIYIIDLQKTVRKIDEAYNFVKGKAAERNDAVRRDQETAHDTISKRRSAAACIGSTRWLGGMLTNFATIRKRVDRMKQLEDGTGRFFRTPSQEGSHDPQGRIRKLVKNLEGSGIWTSS